MITRTKERYLLSVCLPTHNREEYLKEGLALLSRLDGIEDVEIVIADDASTDNTEGVVKDVIKRNRNLRILYKKFSDRQYFDRIVLKMIEMANSNYCWLISDDDVPVRDSLKRIKNILSKNTELSLIHMNYSRFDKTLGRVTAKKMVGSIERDKQYISANEFFFKPIKNSYFNFLGTNVITMSTNVVNRKMWLEATKKVKKHIGHNFIHCFVIATMIKENPRIYYLARPNIQYLANNHRIWPNDIWKDYNQVFLGYLMQIGFSKSKIRAMQEMQKKYEKRESAMKHPLLKYSYPLVKPLLASLRYIKSRLS